MRIEINLATHAYEDARRFVRQWAITVALVLLVTGVLSYGAFVRLKEWRVEQNRINALQAQIDHGDREIAEAQAFLNRPENRDMRDKSQILNELIVRKAFSWTQVFSDLERIMPPRLHVVSIRPELNPENQLELRMVVAGESSERALDLVRRMERSPRFRQPAILAQAAQEAGQSKGDKVHFDISAVYVPALAREAQRVTGQVAHSQTSAPQPGGGE
jgi:Tfp pilus assembly protein PilN